MCHFNSDSLTGHWLWALFPLVGITKSLFGNNTAGRVISIVFWTVLFWGNFGRMFEFVFKGFYPMPIPLRRIRLFETMQDKTGFETFIPLEVEFRKNRNCAFWPLKKPYKPFTELSSQSISQTQFA